MNAKVAAAAVASTLALAACHDDDDNDPFADASDLNLRVIHAAPDAPAVNVLVDDEAVLASVDYKEGSGFLTLEEGSYDVEVEAIVPGGNVTVIDLPATELAADTDYTVLAVGTVSDDTLEPLVIANAQSDVGSGNVRVQVLHAAPDAPAVDVYVTAPDDPLEGATPLGSFGFREELGPVEVPGGDYRIRVTLAGDSDALAFDSGTVPLAAGADLLVAAVTNTAAGAAPISLLVNDGQTQSELFDVATPASIRVGHLSADAPAVDVVVNDDFEDPAVSGLVYPQLTAYLAVAPGDYNFKVVDSASQAITAIDLDKTLEIGRSYSVLAVNALSSIEPLELADDNRSVATHARVRLIHAAPAAGDVDVYVTAPDADITATSPALADVPFKANSGYIALAAGAYEISVTPAGDNQTVAINAELALEAGDVYTIIARDAPGGGPPLGAEVIDEID
jgi:hypothetical protein